MVGSVIATTGSNAVFKRVLIGLTLSLSLVAAVAAFRAGAVPAVAQDVRIAAVVNDSIITTSDLSNRSLLILRSSGLQDTPENRQRLSARVLRTLIDEKLETQEAKRLNITASKEDIDAAVERLVKQNNLPKGGIDKFLQNLGIPKATLIDQITASLTWNKVIQTRISADVSVADQEVNELMQRVKETGATPQSNVSEIFLAVDSPAQDDEVKRLADRLEQQLKSGGSFASIAQQFSQSPTAADGGSLGWINPSEISPALGKTLETLSPGEISPPVRASGGYYILGLLDRRIPGQSNPNEAQVSVIEAGAPVPATAPAEFRERLAKALQDLARNATSCPAFAAAARKLGLPFVKDAPNVMVSTMAPNIRHITLDLKIGQISKPFPVQGGVGLVMLCGRKDAPPPQPPTAEQVRLTLEREHFDILARRYLRDLRRNAYVDIRG